MSSLSALVDALSRWLACVAVTLAGLKSRLAPARRVRLIETANGDFAIEPQQGAAAAAGLPDAMKISGGRVVGTVSEPLRALFNGSQIEVVLNPGRFLFKQLELPEAASAFLAGVVRSQIDRLTPWSSEAAAFGWTKPEKAGTDRILVTVVATARAVVQPFFDALSGFGASSVVLATVPQAAGPRGEHIRIADQNASGAPGHDRLQRVLAGILLAAALLAAVATIGSSYIVSGLEAEQDQIVKRIAARRAALRDSGPATGGAAAALRGLEQRKHQEPSRVVVLDALSKVLPDHTYITEFRAEANRLKVIGLTQDAPGLIRLIEQSDYFTRATFFAPTTRGEKDPGERFHIEMQIGRAGQQLR